jgi:hypothetical protein
MSNRLAFFLFLIVSATHSASAQSADEAPSAVLGVDEGVFAEDMSEGEDEDDDEETAECLKKYPDAPPGFGLGLCIDLPPGSGAPAAVPTARDEQSQDWPSQDGPIWFDYGVGQ